MQLSIIIPVLNTPLPILRRCLDSINGIAGSNIEVIIVDNGSSYKNKKSYEDLRNDFTKVVFESNRGVSRARNRGVEESSGEYIMFIDSDDELLMGKKELGLLRKGYDLYLFDYETKTRRKTMNVSALKDVVSGEVKPNDVIEQFFLYDKCYPPFAKVYRKEFLRKNSIIFDERIVNGEDAVYNLSVLKNDPHIYYCKKNIYRYYYSESHFVQRLKDNYIRIMDDYFLKYELKNSIARKKDDKKLYAANYNSAVDHVFRVSMICNAVKIKEPKLDSYMKKMNIDYEMLSVTNKRKYCMVMKKRSLLIAIFAFLRRVYIGAKGRAL